MLHYQFIVDVNEALAIGKVTGTLCGVEFDSYILYEKEEFNPDVDLQWLMWVTTHVVSKTPAELLIKYSREYQL